MAIIVLDSIHEFGVGYVSTCIFLVYEKKNRICSASTRKDRISWLLVYFESSII